MNLYDIFAEEEKKASDKFKAENLLGEAARFYVKMMDTTIPDNARKAEKVLALAALNYAKQAKEHYK